MAADKAAVASGADVSSGLRKRPVADDYAANAPARPAEIDEKKKKLAKKVWALLSARVVCVEISSDRCLPRN